MIFKEIAVIGGGVIGRTTAFYLASLGHNVEIIDPELNQPNRQSTSLTGSKASLGVLMGNTFRRTSGRSWELRQRSMQLWPELIKKINQPENELTIETPLIQLARNAKEMELMKTLSKERENLGLQFLDFQTKEKKSRPFPVSNYGGIISTQDGRINPIKLLNCLMQALNKLNVLKRESKVQSLKQISGRKEVKWEILLENNQILVKDDVIICSALGSTSLLKSIGYDYLIDTVLGQAIEVTLETDDQTWEEWPSVLIAEGINLIPQRKNQLIIGATLEPGMNASFKNLKKMIALNGSAPQWLNNAVITDHWYGLRVKPQKQAAPILEKPEPGLIINTAHYRNGVLLAPACAEWVTHQI